MPGEKMRQIFFGERRRIYARSRDSKEIFRRRI